MDLFSSRITLLHDGEIRIEEKKSVFIGNAAPVSNAGEAADFVASVRSRYPDARHVVYAWTVSGEALMKKYSDDGEPSGTGGLPVLSVLEKKGITNAVITVTRYFGGILLGKGGLIRAYTAAACASVEAAVPVSVELKAEYRLTAEYPTADRLIPVLRDGICTVDNVSYGEKVEITCSCGISVEDEFLSVVTEKTGGRIIPERLGVRETKEVYVSDEK